MKNIQYIIAGIIVLIVIVGAFLIIVPNQSTSPLQAEPLPSMEFEGTVISLSLVGGEAEGGDITRPRDTLVVRIDKINSISSDFDWVSAGIEEGKEITVQTQYGTRPAKIRKVFDPEAPVSSGNESPVSATFSFGIENGYFVYSTKSGTITEETEIVLPGLEEGSKFKATGSYGFGYQGITIGYYEIIP